MRRLICAPDTGVLEAVPAEPAQEWYATSQFMWLDLDRSEAERLSTSPLGLPTPFARELLDAAISPRFQQHGDFRRLSVLAAELNPHRLLADLDIVEGPDLVITVHGGTRSPLEHLIGGTIWPRSGPGSPHREAVALLLDVIVDGYDQFILEAEAEADDLRQGRGPSERRRIDPDAFLRIRRQMVNLHRGLISERDAFAAYAASLPPSEGAERLRGIRDRLQSVLDRSLLAAEYAQDGAMATRRAVTRGPILAVVLAASWLTFLATTLIISLAVARGSEGLTAGFLAGVVLLGTLTASVLLFGRGRRWL